MTGVTSAAIYLGEVHGTHRSNLNEIRFQSPGCERPNLEESSRLTVLVGLCAGHEDVRISAPVLVLPEPGRRLVSPDGQCSSLPRRCRTRRTTVRPPKSRPAESSSPLSSRTFALGHRLSDCPHRACRHRSPHGYPSHGSPRACHPGTKNVGGDERLRT